MPFWLAVTLLAVCMLGGLGAVFLSYQNNESRYFILAAVAGLLALGLLIYLGVAFVFAGKTQPLETGAEIAVAAPCDPIAARIDPYIDAALAKR